MDRTLELFALSSLEKGRIREPSADPTNLSAFHELESLIASSLPRKAQAMPHKPEPLSRASVRAASAAMNRAPLRDQAVLERLIRMRNQIPLSSRIIRAGES